MDLDKNLIDISQVTLYCVSVGKEKNSFLKTFISTLNDKLSRIIFSAFYQTDLKEKAKASFPLKVEFINPQINCT